MKVLYIIHSSNNGGATISFRNMVEGVIVKGVEPVVVMPLKVHPDFHNWIHERQIKTYRIHLHDAIFPPCTTWRNIIKFPYRLLLLTIGYLTDIRKITTIIDEEKPDIVHSNVGVLHCGFYAARKRRIPHVWHLREYQDKDFGWRIFPSKWCFKKLLRQSYVITITEDILQYFNLAKCIYDGILPKAKCIYNGILTSKYVEDIIPKEDYFMTANNLVPAKSMETTIRGFATFLKTHPNYKLKICGNGSPFYISQLKQLAMNCGCADSIEWLGFTDDVTNLMTKARGLVVSSRSEGLGRMTVEACFKGCIPIGRNTGGTKEVINYTGGVLFDEDEELPQRLSQVADMTDEEYKSIVLTAQKRAISKFSNEVSADQIYDFYKQILSR